MEKKRASLQQKIRRAALFSCIGGIAIMDILWLVSLFILQSTSVADSENLGMSAAQSCKNAVLAQSEQALVKDIQNYAEGLDDRLGEFADYLNDFTYYAQKLYEAPGSFVSSQLPLANAASALDNYSPHLTLRDLTVPLNSVRSEANLLGNLKHVWEPVMKNHNGAVLSVYLGAANGFIISCGAQRSFMQPYYNFYECPWYSTGKDASGPIFTDIYIDSYDKERVVTCASPFNNKNGDFAGVMCIDILVSDLAKPIEEAKLGDGAHAFLIDSSGEIIASPNMDKEKAENIGDSSCAAHEAAQSILSGEAGITTDSSGNYYAYAPVPSSGWTLAAYVPSSVVAAPAEAIGLDISEKTGFADNVTNRNIFLAVCVMIFAFIAVTAAVIILSRRISRRLTAPLLELKEDVDKIRGGDLSCRAEASNDEIGELARSLNDITDSIEKFTSDINYAADKKSGLSGSDELSALCLEFKNKMTGEGDEITLAAKAENIPEATEFINARLKKAGCKKKLMALIDMATDELMSNIANYAYPEGGDSVTVRFRVIGGYKRTAEITFTDSGIEFDPLSAPLRRASNKSPVGDSGGIYRVRKSMDSMSYRRAEGRNILKIEKRF